MIGMNFIARHGIKALVALVAIGVVCMVAEPYLAASPSAPRSKSTEADSHPRVEVVHPRRITVARRLQTNATLEAFEETDLFAKVSGYLSDVRVGQGPAQIQAEFARERAPRTGALQGEHNASGRLVEAPGGAVHGTLDQRPGA